MRRVLGALQGASDRDRRRSVMESTVGVEPTHSAFAERRVPVSPRRHFWHGRLGTIQQPLDSESSAPPVVLLPYLVRVEGL